MLFLWISDMWLGQREDLMEVNYFWHSWLAVCFHGKAHSPWHEHSHRQPANARPWIPHLSNVIFEISTHDSCFDSRVSNVTLRWSSELKVLPITIARTEHPKIAREYDFFFFFFYKKKETALGVGPAQRGKLRTFHSGDRKCPFLGQILHSKSVFPFGFQVHAVWDSVRSSLILHSEDVFIDWQSENRTQENMCSRYIVVSGKIHAFPGLCSSPQLSWKSPVYLDGPEVTICMYGTI